MKGSGFKPGEDMEVTLFSDPIVLGYPKADGEGNFTFTAHIPAGVPAGTHTLVARGLESGGTAQMTIKVLAVGSESTGVKNLAETGVADAGRVVAYAGFSILAGLGLMLLVRRLRRTSRGGTA